MRRSKADVERYISSVKSLSPSQNEKPVKGFLFAKLYFEAKEYELAKRHLSEYLTVQVRDPKAHRFLGQLYELEGEIEKAVGCYKRSVDLNPAQRDLVLKVAELLCSKQELDSRAEFWVEKAAKLLPGHPAVFDLREKLLSAQGQQSLNQLYDLLQSELQLRPADAHVNRRLVLLYCFDGRLEEAAKHCVSVERSGVLRHSLDWYTTIIQTIQKYVAQPTVSSNVKTYRQFQKELLLAHCNLLRHTLAEKDCRESVTALQTFDHAMQSLKNIAMKDVDELSEIFIEMRAHLYLYAGTLLLKMAEEKEQQWRAVVDLAALCYLLAYQVPRPKTKPEKVDQTSSNLVTSLACYRQSQAGHMLLNLKQDTDNFVKEVVEVFGNKGGQDALFEMLFGTTAPKDLSFIGSDDIFSISTQTPAIQELAKWDSGSVLHCGDLQHLTWLGLQWSMMGQRPALKDWLKLLFPRLSLETFKLDSNTPESICLLDLEKGITGVAGTIRDARKLTSRQILVEVLNADNLLITKDFWVVTQVLPRQPLNSSKELFIRELVDVDGLGMAPELLSQEVFLCGVVFTSHTQLLEASKVSPSPQLHKPRCLPLQLIKLLSTERQREWWDAVYSLIHKRALPNMSAKLRMIVQHGLNTLRASEKHGLQPALLIHWAKHLSITGDSMNSYYDQKEYVGRSVHYWKVALPLLEKIENRRSIPEPLNPLFLHFSSKDIQVSESKGYKEDALVAFAILLDIEGKTEQAILKLEKLNCISSHWHLARIYQRLSDEAGNGVEETQHMCINFLQQFKKYLSKIYHASADDAEKLPVSLEEIIDLLNDVNQQLGESGEAVDQLDERLLMTSSPRSLVEPALAGSFKFSMTSSAKNGHSPSKRPVFSPKTPPPWVEDQKSVLQMLCRQVEALKNEVHDLRHNSSTSTEPPFHQGYSAEAFQEPVLAAQNLHGVPLTVATTGPSAGYNQSPAYNSQYLLRTASNVTPSKAPVYTRLPQPHIYAYQQSTHTPPHQATCMYTQDQVFGTPLRFEAPATTLLSPYNDDYCSHNVSQPSTNPALPEPGYFTKPSAIPTQSSKSSEGKPFDLKMNFGQEIPNETPKGSGIGGAAAQPTSVAAAFKFNSNFKSNDGDFTFSSAEAKSNSESLLGLLTSGISSRNEGSSTLRSPSKYLASSHSEAFTLGSKTALGFLPADSSQGKTPLYGKSEKTFGFANVPNLVPVKGNYARCVESDDSKHVEEDEDGPHFEPIVPLPDKVDVKTGEEEEEEIFCNRAKLFRFEAELKEWKERGIGCIKILKHKTSSKYRLLMRREQVLKICANHYITADMVLKPNSGSDKSWVWYAIDYADEMPKTEQLAIRFKTVDEAALFKTKFEEAQRSIGKSIQSQLKEDEAKPPPHVETIKKMDLRTQFAKKEGQWDCSVCCVRNESSCEACVACNTPNPFTNAQAKPATVVSAAPVVTSSSRTFTFGLSESSKGASHHVGFSGFGSQVPFSFNYGMQTPVTSSSQGDKRSGQWDASAQKSVSQSESSSSQSVSTSSVTPSFSFDSGFGSQFAKKPGQWDCSVCAVRNEATASTCVSCQSTNSSVKTIASAEPVKTSAGADFSFVPCPDEGKWVCKKCFGRNEATATKCTSCQMPNANLNLPSSKSSSISFGFDDINQPKTIGLTANFDADCTSQFGQNNKQTTGATFQFKPSVAVEPSSNSSRFAFSASDFANGFKFGLPEPEVKPSDDPPQSGSASMFLKSIAEQHRDKEIEVTSPVQSVSKPSANDCQPFTSKLNTFSFAELANASEGQFKFGKKDPNFKGFAGAGEQVFTSVSQSQKADSSTDQEEEDMYRTEENDDIQFEPVVSMPEKVDLVTGEEDEVCLYSNRVKLFRFDPETHQWKERGVGNLKILKNNLNGRLRVLMRREQVLKVCANHWITTSMTLKPLSGSDRAWMWLANDFSDGDAKLEQLAVKFKTPELAEEFKQKFDECQRLLLDIPLQTPHKLCNSDRTANLIQKAEEMKTGLKDLKSFLTYNSSRARSEENNVTPENVSELAIKHHSDTGATLEWDNYDLQDDVHDASADTSVYASPLASSPLQKNLFRFGESSAGFSFNFQPIVSPSKSPSKLSQNRSFVGTNNEQEANQEEEKDGQYFEPIVPLPDLVEISTGEENEQIVFTHRAKLYRYDKDLNQWKERGIGDIKILQNYDTKRTRLVMRRDQILKLCANHWITSNMNLEPMKGTEKAWIWSAYDFAEGEGTVEQLAVRFKLQETANSFKDFFDKAKEAQEKQTLLPSVTLGETLTSQETICGKTAIALLEETTREQSKPSGLSSASSPTPAVENLTAPHITSKTLVSPPKFVFGTDSVQKIFGSPLLSKQMVPSSNKGFGEKESSRASSSSQQLRGQTVSPMSPFKVPERVSSQVEQDARLTEDSSVEIVFERQPTKEQAELARELMLPLTFFNYKNKEGYKSDESEDEDYETAVRNLKGKLYPDSPTPCSAQASGGVEDSDCVIIWEKKPTLEEERKARSLQLPLTFFCGIGNETETEPDRPDDFQTELQKVWQAQSTINRPKDSCCDDGRPLNTCESRTEVCSASSTTIKAVICPIDLSKKNHDTEAPADSDTSQDAFGFVSLGGFSFADLAKTSGDFAFGEKDSTFSWANAGAAVFSSNVTTSQNEDEEEVGSGEDVSNTADIHFEPIVSLPEIEVKSGEEDEEILFKERAKLYRWDRDLNQWKERGVGDLKILFHPLNNNYRLLMRREQVLKVCANHTITSDLDLKPMNTTANALVWIANDYAEGTAKVEQLAAKFKTLEVAEAFKKTFTQCQTCMSQADVVLASKITELSRPSNPLVFFTIAVDEVVIGQITMELFTHIVPKTAENFRVLCTGAKGFGYQNSVFHRIIPDFVCQGGDITNQDGTGGKSIYGGKFEDENFDVRHTGPGLLSMANSGRDTNSSQFFITLKKAEHLDFKHVAFGFVKDGMDVVKQMGKLGSKSGKPSKKITVTASGQL